MIECNGHIVNADVTDILIELRKQLEVNGHSRFAKIVPSGHNIQTNCPFHKNGQERKPSFGISNQDGSCHCFGCGWSGSLQEMISNCFGKDDFGVFGTRWLIKNFLTINVEERKDVTLDYSRTTVNINLDRHNYVSEEELDSYRYIHPYMYKRKLTDEIIDLFDIGYDSKTECITFPNRDINGNTLFIARRSVNTKFFNYPADVEKPVYGLYEWLTYGWAYGAMGDGTFARGQTKRRPISPDVIICESMLDALTCWVYGKYAVALNGTGDESQFKTLREMPNRKFILATDMDEAGLKARKRLKEALDNKLVTEYVWDVKVAKDINDMSKEMFDNLREVF